MEFPDELGHELCLAQLSILVTISFDKLILQFSECPSKCNTAALLHGKL